MSMAKGKNEYVVDNKKVVAFGVSHTTEEMEEALKNEVYNKLFDVEEHSEITDMLSETGFDKALLMEKLFPITEKEEWEIGEAYAQAYAEENMNSLIPWGISRDIKKPGSSLPGADIIGLYKDEEDVCFLFGEVKTSSQVSYPNPPSVMYGEHGLKKQLEDLCSNIEITDSLVRYLAYRLKKSTMWEDFKKAWENYNTSSGQKVHIIGVLIRDVEPKEEDLKARANGLQSFAVEGRKIELVGIYLPVGSVAKFPDIIQKEHERRSISSDKE